MIALVILIVYFIIGTLIALVSRRFGVKTSMDYYVAGYRLSGLLAAMTYAATTYSAFMMIGLVGFVYAYGIGGFGFENLYLASTIFLLTLFAPRVWRTARERKWISPAEMIGDLYGSRKLSAIISIIYLVALIPYSTAQLVGIGSLFEGLNIGYVYGVLVGGMVVFLWIFLAGIWSVASTDAYQGLWMISASTAFIAWIIAYLLPSNGLDPGSALRVVGDKGLLGITSFWKPSVFLAFTLPWIFFAVTNPQVVQRIYMPRNEKALKNMIIYFALFGLTYTVLVTFIGLYARALTIKGSIPDLTSTRDLVTPKLLALADPLLGAVVFTSIVAAAVSTLDSIILTLSSSVSRDLVSLYKRLKGRSEMMLNYLVVAVLVLVTTYISLSRPGFIVELSVLSSVMLLPLAPVTITAWLKPEMVRGSSVAATASLLIGSLTGIYAALVYGAKKAFIVTFLGLPISFWILFSSTIILLIGLTLRRRR